MKIKVDEKLRMRSPVDAELLALEHLAIRFSGEMFLKLAAKCRAGRRGWDDLNWTPEQIRQALVEHVEKGDPVDIANFCAFLWNREDGE